MGIELPAELTQGPYAGGLINLPAVVIVWFVTGLLLFGLRESATLNAIFVVLKILGVAGVHADRLPGVRPRPTSTLSCRMDSPRTGRTTRGTA